MALAQNIIDKKFDEVSVAIDEIIKRLNDPAVKKNLEKAMKDWDRTKLDPKVLIEKIDKAMQSGFGGEGLLSLRVGLSLLPAGSTIDFSNFEEAIRTVLSKLDRDGNGELNKDEIKIANTAPSTSAVAAQPTPPASSAQPAQSTSPVQPEKAPDAPVKGQDSVVPTAADAASVAQTEAQPAAAYTTKQLQLYQLAKLLGKEEFTKSYGVESMSLIDNLPLPPAFGASENQNQGRS